MERCNTILRMLSAVVLALALVLIPLAQAEALPSCSEIDPGYTASGCDWSAVCNWWATNEYITNFWGQIIGVQRIDHYEHDYVTILRPTWSPDLCRETNRYCSSSCYLAIPGPIIWF